MRQRTLARDVITGLELRVQQAEAESARLREQLEEAQREQLAAGHKRQRDAARKQASILLTLASQRRDEVDILKVQLSDARAALATAQEVLTKYGKHPDSCPKGVGIGYYKPPANAKCNCGIDAALASPRSGARKPDASSNEE